MGAPQVAAGWHDDPSGTGQLRWWDGAQWTDHLAPRPDAAPAPQPAAIPQAAAAPFHPVAATQAVPAQVTYAQQQAATPAEQPRIVTPSLPQGDAPSVQKAFVMGILAIVFNLFFIPSILAIRWGRAAREEIDMSRGRLTGEGKAKAARVLGWTGVGLGVVGIVVGVFIVVAGAAVVSEASGDIAYTEQMDVIGADIKAALAPLQGEGVTPAQVQGAIAGMEAQGVKLHAVEPPAKVATEHAELVAGFDQTLAGMKELQAATAATPAAKMEASLAKMTQGGEAIEQASLAIDAKLIG